MTGFTPKIRALIHTRDGGCVVCGRADGLNIHHRTPRGMGGSKASWANQAPNGIVLCGSGTTGCHGRVESNRAWAEANGYIVRHGIELPEHVPVQHVLYGEVWLTRDGRVVDVKPDPVF